VKGELYNFHWSRRPALMIRPTNRTDVIFNEAGRSSALRYLDAVHTITDKRNSAASTRTIGITSSTRT